MTTATKTPTTPTHTSYAKANAAARAKPNTTYTSDAGGGWTHHVYYCTWRARLIHSSVSPAGFVVH